MDHLPAHLPVWPPRPLQPLWPPLCPLWVLPPPWWFQPVPPLLAQLAFRCATTWVPAVQLSLGVGLRRCYSPQRSIPCSKVGLSRVNFRYSSWASFLVCPHWSSSPCGSPSSSASTARRSARLRFSCCRSWRIARIAWMATSGLYHLFLPSSPDAWTLAWLVGELVVASFCCGSGCPFAARGPVATALSASLPASSFFLLPLRLLAWCS